MRRAVAFMILAVGLASTAALAANDKVTATFESLSASGVSGDAQLNPMPQGGTLIHANLRGLQPNTEYVSFIYQNGTCASGAPTTELIRFTANPSGNANFNTKVTQTLPDIQSLSVQVVSDLSLVACAPVGQ